MVVNDLLLLEITKVKPWAIYFNYGNKHYLLHGKASMFEIFLEVWRTENKKHE